MHDLLERNQLARQERQRRSRTHGPDLAADQGPGMLRVQGPRHDNDHARIIDIRVPPTHQELLTELPPYLPPNRPGGSPHLPPGSPEAVIDCLFRLLREDLLRPLRKSLTALMTNGGLRSLGRRQQFMDAGDSGTLMALYRRVRFENLLLKDGGWSLLVNFAELTHLAHQTQQQRFEAWTRSKRLASGSLVALVWEELGQPQLACLSVAERDAAIMVPLKGDEGRVRIGLRPLNTLPRGLFEALGDGRREVVMVQAGASYFAYQPVLRALKATSPPPFFAKYCKVYGDGEQLQAEPPEFVSVRTAAGQPVHLDLTCLPRAASSGDTDGDALLSAQLKHVDPAHPEAFPIQALMDWAGLNQSQAEAIRLGLCSELPIIQGPPGTGKTFVGAYLAKILVANRKRLGLHGPILVLAYTNHALDR